MNLLLILIEENVVKSEFNKEVNLNVSRFYFFVFYLIMLINFFCLKIIILWYFKNFYVFNSNIFFDCIFIFSNKYYNVKGRRSGGFRKCLVN